MVRDVGTWRALIDEYARLERLAGHTPQSRGQRFNGVIAELFECWGLEARANDRSKGEIDVGFTHEGVRYVLEAKWEKTKADFGDLAKLRSRVTQRLSGTYGIFLAMAGYTPEALSGVSDGQRLELLLLDRSHWEAMLTGLVPPQELLNLVRDQAAFHGDAFTPLATLLAQSARPPEIEFGGGTRTEPILESASEGAHAQVVLSVARSDQLGITGIGRDELLLTMSAGIVRANLATRTVTAAVEVPHCHRKSVLLPDGSILFTRRLGVGRFHNGEISCVAGGAAGATCLVEAADDSTWLLDNGEPSGQTPASIMRIGLKLGEQARHALAYPHATATNAAWIAPDRLLVIGAAGSQTTTLFGDDTPLTAPSQTNPMGLLRTAEHVVLTAGDGITIAATDLMTGTSTELACLALRGSVSDLTQSPTGEIYLAAYDRGSDVQTYAVVRLEVDAPTRVPPHTPSAGPSSHETSSEVSDPAPASEPQLQPSAASSQNGHQDHGTTLSAFDQAVAALAAERQREHERGYRDAVAFAPNLGWPTLASLAERRFDLTGWLEGWRNGWRDVQMGSAPDGVVAALWLPGLADLLGNYVDPIGFDHWSFTPSATYIDGFIDGLRAVWASASTGNPGSNPGLPPGGLTPTGTNTGTRSTTDARQDPREQANPEQPVAPAARTGDSQANNPRQTLELVTVKGVLGSINFDGETVTIRKEGHGPRMKGIRTLPVAKIEKVLVKPATALYHGYIQFVVRDHPPAPDRSFSTASGRPHREDPDSMSYQRRANKEIDDLRMRIEAAIAHVRFPGPAA